MSFEPPRPQSATPAEPVSAPPPRRAGSLRRTASWQTVWPEGLGRPCQTIGRARDLYTSDATLAPHVVREDWIDVRLSPYRLILDIAASRLSPALAALVGLRPGGPVRRELLEIFAEDVTPGCPLYLLLDDLAGASLVSPGAWMAWVDDWREQYAAALDVDDAFATNVTDVCVGFHSGSNALTSRGAPDFALQSNVTAPFPRGAGDPDAWHELPDSVNANHRRSRRLDAWYQEGLLHADVWFQDSNALPGTDLRRVVHEYQLRARIDPDGLMLHELEITPLVLPYRECPGAVTKAMRMVGRPVADFRRAVPATLPGPLGCTHLNDMLRGLEDIGAMATDLTSLATCR